MSAKAAKGQAEELASVYRKLLDPQKQFKPIPKIVYYSMQEKVIEYEIAVQGDTVNISFKPSSNFAVASESLWNAFKTYGFDKIAKEGFNFQAEMTSPQTFLDKIVSFAVCED